MTKKEEMKEIKIDYEIDICDKHQQIINFYNKETNKFCCIECILEENEIINKKYTTYTRNEMNKTMNNINKKIENIIKEFEEIKNINNFNKMNKKIY